VGDGLVAVRAERAGPDPAAEELAVFAAAHAEVALLASGALIDGVGRSGDRRRGRALVGVAGAPVGLFAGI